MSSAEFQFTFQPVAVSIRRRDLPLPESVDSLVQRKYWIQLLARYGQNKRAAAREAGVSRTSAYKILSALDVEYPLDRSSHRGIWEDLTDKR